MRGKRVKLLRKISGYSMKEERKQNRILLDRFLKRGVRHWGREYVGRKLSPWKNGVTLFCNYKPRVIYKQWKKRSKRRREKERF